MKKKPNRKDRNERELCESVDVACPFCGQIEPVAIDEGGGEHQTFVEDCSVCCRPRVLHLDSSADVRRPRVWAERDDGQ
jgi:hypothetical protein